MPGLLAEALHRRLEKMGFKDVELNKRGGVVHVPLDVNTRSTRLFEHVGGEGSRAERLKQALHQHVGVIREALGGGSFTLEDVTSQPRRLGGPREAQYDVSHVLGYKITFHA